MVVIAVIVGAVVYFKRQNSMKGFDYNNGAGFTQDTMVSSQIVTVSKVAFVACALFHQLCAELGSASVRCVNALIAAAQACRSARCFIGSRSSTAEEAAHSTPTEQEAWTLDALG